MSDLDDNAYFEKMLSFINNPEKKQKAIIHYKEQNKRTELQSSSITETELKELYKNELIKDGIINDSDIDLDEFDEEDDEFEESTVVDEFDPQNVIVGEKTVIENLGDEVDNVFILKLFTSLFISFSFVKLLLVPMLNK